MGFKKRLRIAEQIQPGNICSVLTKLVETKVINMCIYEENTVWIWCSLRGIKYISKSDPVATVRKVKKVKLFWDRNKKNKGRKKG